MKKKMIFILLLIITFSSVAAIIYYKKNFIDGVYEVIDLNLDRNEIIVGKEVTEPILNSNDEIVNTTFIRKYQIIFYKNYLILDSSKNKTEISTLEKGDKIYIVRKQEKWSDDIYSEVIKLKNVIFIKILDK